jgi:hypothetical protein
LFELDLLTAVHGVLKLAMVNPQIHFQPWDVGEMAEIEIEAKVFVRLRPTNCVPQG